jgi:hypothetical protein
VPHESKIKPSYKQINAIYLSRDVIDQSDLAPGVITVFVEHHPEFSVDGRLNNGGGISGMSRLYSLLSLEPGDVLVYSVTANCEIVIHSVRRASTPSITTPAAQAAAEPKTQEYLSVYRRKNLRAIHIELFSPENLRRWEPENEPDVYMAFGILQEHTKFRYCCATSRALLNRLGYVSETKPDAILIDDNTGEYLIAEFKMSSTAFTSNHQRDDVDVLVVWHHDDDRVDLLPHHIVCLKDIARTAAQELLELE